GGVQGARVSRIMPGCARSGANEAVRNGRRGAARDDRGGHAVESMYEPLDTQESATFWRASDLDDLELLRASYVKHSFAPHTPEGFVLGGIEGGVALSAYRPTPHPPPAGAVVLINPAEMHTGAAALPTGWKYRMLYPGAVLLQQAASELAGRA